MDGNNLNRIPPIIIIKRPPTPLCVPSLPMMPQPVCCQPIVPQVPLVASQMAAVAPPPQVVYQQPIAPPPSVYPSQHCQPQICIQPEIRCEPVIRSHQSAVLSAASLPERAVYVRQECDHVCSPKICLRPEFCVQPKFCCKPRPTEEKTNAGNTAAAHSCRCGCGLENCYCC